MKLSLYKLIQTDDTVHLNRKLLTFAKILFDKVLRTTEKEIPIE